MAEIRTFSGAVDLVLSETGRPEIRTKQRIIRYVRQTIRELRVKVFFRRDRVETEIIAGTDNFVWTEPDNLRMLETVVYPNEIYPKLITPGKLQKDEEHYYYGGENYIVFAGIVSGQKIKLSYFIYPKFFHFYENGPLSTVPDRPAYYDDELDTWFYLNNGAYESQALTSLTTAQQEAAEKLVSDWLLFKWYDIIPEGAAAKVFKQIDDNPERARSTFALFKSFENDLLKGEPYESLEF